MTSNRREIEARLLAWMDEAEPAADDARFEELCLALFRIQYEHCPPFARFCQRRGRTPESVGAWQQIPAVPTGAFKEVALRSFPAERTVHVFRTSGTATRKRGCLYLDDLGLYEASLLPSFERGVLPELRGTGGRARLLVLAPPASEVPDSSLSHMFDVVLRRCGDPDSGSFLRNGRLEVDALLSALTRACEEGARVALCGTAFAFVHLLEAMAKRERRLELPASSRVMETGGFKGLARERSREDLYAEITLRLGVPEARIVNQYGMTELGSQFYDSVLVSPDGPRRKLAPPWTRVRVLDPGSGEPCAPGEPGMITIVDLANTGSVLAVQTADLGRSVEGGFEVLGRSAGAESRGCSIAVDDMLDAVG